jgi:aspartate racemase
MHTHSLAEYMKCIDRDDWQGVGDLMLSSANKLAKIGADFLICPDNTIHQALPHIAAQLPLKWLHIAEAVAAQAVGRQFRRLGLTGTRYLVESEVYPEKLKTRGLEYVRPTFQRVMERMKNEGCDAVVLGCTEIPLIMNDANSPLPTLDSTRLLARAALRRAVQARAVPA